MVSGKLLSNVATVAERTRSSLVRKVRTLSSPDGSKVPLLIAQQASTAKAHSKPSVMTGADKEKKVKKTKKKEDAAPEPEPEAAPAPEAKKPSVKASSGSSKRAAKRTGSNVFSMFSQTQIAEFKEGFQMMDHDHDGIISKSDLRATFDAVGKISNDKELDEMLNEASGPINFTQMLQLFGNRMSGGGATDDDDIVINAFKSFDKDGYIDSEQLSHALMTWGDKFTQKEVNEAMDACEVDDDGKINTQALILMLTAKGEEEEGGEAAE